MKLGKHLYQISIRIKNTWCDIANEDFANLKKHHYGLYGIYAYDRPGARTKYGHHGPGGNR